MVYSLNKLKNVKNYYGTGRAYLQACNGHIVTMNKARAESKSGESVNVYVEADGVPLQMVRSYKNGALEYVADKIQ